MNLSQFSWRNLISSILISAGGLSLLGSVVWDHFRDIKHSRRYEHTLLESVKLEASLNLSRLDENKLQRGLTTVLFQLEGMDALNPFKTLNHQALDTLLLNIPQNLASNNDDLRQTLTAANYIDDYNNFISGLNTYLPLMFSQLGVGSEKSEKQRREVLQGYQKGVSDTNDIQHSLNNL
jgi:hypothetical protein